jgi:hypothetical protein
MTDYINAVLQALVHIPPLRDFFIVEENLKNVSFSSDFPLPFFFSSHFLFASHVPMIAADDYD